MSVETRTLERASLRLETLRAERDLLRLEAERLALLLVRERGERDALEAEACVMAHALILLRDERDRLRQELVLYKPEPTEPTSCALSSSHTGMCAPGFVAPGVSKCGRPIPAGASRLPIQSRDTDG